MKMCREPGLGCLETSLAHPYIYTAVLCLLFLLWPKLMILLSLRPHLQPYWAVFQWTQSCCLIFLKHPLQTPLCHHIFTVCADYGNWLLVCLWFCTRKVSNVLGSLLYTLTVWPHVQRRQHSSCYRYANVRVVMVAAPPEISSLLSMISWKHPFTSTKDTHTPSPNLYDLCSHTNDT